jgi:hypothetical protein
LIAQLRNQVHQEETKMSLSTHSIRQIGSAPFQQLVLLAAGLFLCVMSIPPASAADGPLDYRVLATSRTSTMEKELNDAALSRYRFNKVMGGKTAIGGQEVVISMVRDTVSPGESVQSYKLLATTWTSTMQRELQQWADAGYEYLDQTVFETAFGGKEVVVIMQLDAARPTSKSVYRLLATSRTSTMEKELKEAGKDGFLLVGFTVGKTEIGGEELVSILRKN